MSHESCVLRGLCFSPARFCAPLAGYTHSAFRRLVAELGGCGAFWTEMLAARQVLHEDFERSPWLRRRPVEGTVVFQLMVRAGDPLDRILARLGEHGVQAVDLNLACDAPAIRLRQAGSALFNDLSALRATVSGARRHWPGLLTAKLRLGRQETGWEARFEERLRLLEQEGVDAVVVHPRFFEDKFRRRARLELIPWIASLTALPVVANGDLIGPAQVQALASELAPACALMIGRMAVARPWLFAAWGRPLAVDLAPIWRTLANYVLEDFEPAVALRRIQMFTKYFAANYQFGHQFRCAVANAPTLEQVLRCAEEFLSRSPALLAYPVVSGL